MAGVRGGEVTRGQAARAGRVGYDHQLYRASGTGGAAAGAGGAPGGARTRDGRHRLRLCYLRRTAYGGSQDCLGEDAGHGGGRAPGFPATLVRDNSFRCACAITSLIHWTHWCCDNVMHTFRQGWEIIMTGNLTNPRSPTGSARDKQSAIRATAPNTLLQAARHRHGWTQQALADQLGTTPLAINRWEQGKAPPSAYFRTSLCDLFGLTMQELGLAQRESTESLSPRNAFCLVPYRPNPFFTGRDGILEHLHRLLAQDQPGALAHAYALCGLGG